MAAIGLAAPVAAADEILITEALAVRSTRRPDHGAENRCLNELARTMVERPAGMYQHFVELALELCAAGSAGISLLEVTEGGDTIFRWAALAGAFAPHLGGHTPRDFSPCGICLDRGQTILLDRPARRFDYFNAAEPAIVEGLIAPLYSHGGRALGTIWIVSHHQARRFDAEDARQIESLARFLALALENATLLQEKDLLLRELRHRSKNNLQMIVALLGLQRSKAADAAARRVLDDALARVRLLAGVQADLLNRDVESAGLAAIVERLCGQLAQAFASEHIAFAIEVEDVELDPDKVLAAALVVNELVTNAIKHAFPGATRGTISVKIESAAGEGLQIVVSDDGRPLCTDLRGLKVKSLGLGLIEALVSRLDGRVTYPTRTSKTFRVFVP